MIQTINRLALLVPDYDEAIAFFTTVLRFQLIEDRVVDANKRFVVVAPVGGGVGLVLAKASSPEQAACIGHQTSGRVFLFAQTDDF
jgi:catechol 2,3-dioxygenase-like lactoylglutathione lyase family enzyme